MRHLRALKFLDNSIYEDIKEKIESLEIESNIVEISDENG